MSLEMGVRRLGLSIAWGSRGPGSKWLTVEDTTPGYHVVSSEDDAESIGACVSRFACRENATEVEMRS